MLDNYDFSKGIKNPYAESLNNQVTVNIDAENADYFKALAEKTGIPYTKLINLYLADCVKNKRQLAWV